LVFYVAANVGGTGFLTGLAFSAYLRFGYFNRPLLDITARRVALGGAALAAVCSPLIATLARLSAGIPIALGDMLAGIPIVAVFGAVTAGASIRVAQASARRLTSAAAAELETEQREAAAILQSEVV
jgi:hypothetical protein